jgi:cobalt-zinc-cadmium efflux system outer membrane protein
MKHLLRLMAFLVLSGGTAMAENRSAQGSLEPMTLVELERLALEHNPTGTAAAVAVDAAHGRSRQAGAWPNPIIGYSGDELGAGGLDDRGKHGFFVEQTIPLGGKLRLGQQVIERSVDRAEAVRELQRLRVLTSVRGLFFDALAAQRRVELQERLSVLISEAVGVTGQLYNVGAADRPDFLEIEIEARRVQLRLNAAKNRLFAIRQQLAAFVGRPETADRPLSGSIDEAIPELQREATVRALLEKSPLIHAARADLERTRALTAQAGRQTRPDLFVRGGAAYNRERERTGLPIGWEGRVEAGLSLPLFNRNQGAVAAARADEAIAQADLRRLELSLQAQAAAEFATYLTGLRAAEAYRADILPRAEEAFRLYLTRYREMAAAYPQVLVAQRTLFEMSADYLDNLENAWQAAVRLQGFLAGGGLQAPVTGDADRASPERGASVGEGGRE